MCIYAMCVVRVESRIHYLVAINLTLIMFIAVVIKANEMHLFCHTIQWNFFFFLIFFGFVSTRAHHENNPEKLQAIISFGMLAKMYTQIKRTHKHRPKRARTHTEKSSSFIQNIQANTQKKLSSHDCCATFCITVFFFSFVHSFVRLFCALFCVGCSNKTVSRSAFFSACKNPKMRQAQWTRSNRVVLIIFCDLLRFISFLCFISFFLLSFLLNQPQAL